MPEKKLDGMRFDASDCCSNTNLGFVDSSYTSGYNVKDFLLMNTVGHNAIYQRHCATADSGYIQRKLGKMMEDLTVQNDRTVRNDRGDIIQ